MADAHNTDDKKKRSPIARLKHYTAAAKARRKDNQTRNRAIRADLYRSNQGDKGWNQTTSPWHSTLNSLSAGTS